MSGARGTERDRDDEVPHRDRRSHGLHNRRGKGKAKAVEGVRKRTRRGRAEGRGEREGEVRGRAGGGSLFFGHVIHPDGIAM